jgi:hypothetical protein
MMEGGKGGKGDMKGDWSDDEGEEAMEANVTFLMVAFSGMVQIALKTFRYRSNENYYDDGATTSSTNYWEYSNMISGYYFLAAFSIAFTTQLLSMFGIANEINLYVWMGLLGGLGGLVEMVAGLLSWYAYDEAYVMGEDADSTSAELVAAYAVMAAIKEETMMAGINGLATEFALEEVGRDWAKYQMNAAGYENEKGKGGRKGEDWSDCSDDDEECMAKRDEKMDGKPKPENLFIQGVRYFAL